MRAAAALIGDVPVPDPDPDPGTGTLIKAGLLLLSLPRAVAS